MASKHLAPDVGKRIDSKGDIVSKVKAIMESKSRPCTMDIGDIDNAE